LKIGIDARTLYAPVLKGIGVYLQNLLGAMIRLEPSAEFYLYYDARQKTVNRRPVSSKVFERGVVFPTGDRFHCWEQLALPRALSKDRVSLLHSPANTTCLFWKGPRVVTVHDTTIQERKDKTRIDQLYYNTFQPRVLRCSDLICTVSHFSKGNIEKILGIPGDKIRVIHNGISPAFRMLGDEAAVDGVKAKFGIKGDYIFNAGGESPWKNVPRLIEAFASLEGQESLVITGIRSEKIRAELMTRVHVLGLMGRVHLLTYVTAEELIALYNGAVIFVYPSLLEGFGFPPLEAMACGTPVAASDAASIPEVTGEAALLFDGTRAGEIASAMQKLLQDKTLRDKYRARGFERARQFTWQENAKQTLAVYREVLREK